MRSASPHVRRLSVVLVCAVALVGCGGVERDPDKYGDINSKGDGYYGNLMYGCTGVEAGDDGGYADPTLGSRAFCTCLFRGLKETVNFEDAKRFDQQQAKESAGGISVPSNIAKVQETCGKDDSSFG